MPVIRIDDEVWKDLQKRAEPLVDTPNSVLRRLLKLDSPKQETQPLGKVIEVPISKTGAMFQYHLIPFPPMYRSFFPGYTLPMILETDIGVIQTHITSAPNGTNPGDPNAGKRIQSNLGDWFQNHRNLKVGDKLRFEEIEPHKRYKLSVIEGRQ